MPPQGARALIGALFGGRRRGPEVVATLDESQPGAATLEFINEGDETAIALRCFYLDASGGLVRRSLGDLSPAGSATCRIEVDGQDLFRCVWSCDDEKRGLRLWSYDGRYKRLRREKPGSDEAFFRAAYG
jgi:hypothetical protein